MSDEVRTGAVLPQETRLAGATLSIDLKVLQDNWRLMAQQCSAAQCAATVKSNAYGLGIVPVARALSSAGCKTFFVALPSEAILLRSVLPGAAIYILGGLFAEAGRDCADHDIRPVLVSVEQIQAWRKVCQRAGRPLKAGLHVDTGINRLGLSARDVAWLGDHPDNFDGIDVSLVISHLACGGTPGSPMNQQQLDTFNTLRAALPPAPASIANSPGSFLGAEFCLDIIRPGVALFGGNPFDARPNPMSAVAHIYAPILQIRNLMPGETVGYACAWRAERPTRTAILGIGYGDGYPRSLGSPGRDSPAQVMIGGGFAPVIGHVSMDMIVVDVTDIGDEFCRPGVRAEVMGDNVTVDEIAAWAGTVPYEILTRLGSRFARLYSGGDSV